jgi:hypothetical protein
MNTLIKNYENFSLWNVSESGRFKVTDFVLDVYRDVYGWNPPDFLEHREAMREEDESYSNAFFYMIKDESGNALGTSMICCCEEGEDTPMQKEFGIKMQDITKKYPFNVNRIWYMGRFAIHGGRVSTNPDLSKKRTMMYRLLLQAAFRHVVENDNDVVMAECDSRLYRNLNLIGVKPDAITEGKMVMGSVAIPIMSTGSRLRFFCDEYRHILDYDYVYQE